MSHRMPVLLALCVCSLVTGGCAWSRVKVNSEDIQARAKLVRPGVTKAADLASVIGQQPNNILPLKSGQQIYAYNNGDSKTKAFDIILLSISKTNTRTASTYFLVDAQGVVEAVNVGASDEIPWQWWAFGK